MVETMSGIPLDPSYGDGLQPGEYPYTRGLYPTGYRSKLWTMRMFAGFGEPAAGIERVAQHAHLFREFQYQRNHAVFGRVVEIGRSMLLLFPDDCLKRFHDPPSNPR